MRGLIKTFAFFLLSTYSLIVLHNVIPHIHEDQPSNASIQTVDEHDHAHHHHYAHDHGHHHHGSSKEDNSCDSFIDLILDLLGHLQHSEMDVHYEVYSTVEPLSAPDAEIYWCQLDFFDITIESHNYSINSGYDEYLISDPPPILEGKSHITDTRRGPPARA